jgi:iron only hydrogenase large subunit-like protein
MRQEYFHSVTLDKDKCKGCTNCIKHCPTEAIRVRGGKAEITRERCIDCGECIRVCPYHAKKAISDPFAVIGQYRYRIALPAPSLYGQFNPAFGRGKILGALLRIGFDDVFEVAAAAEVVSDATRRYLEGHHVKMPVISTACPAVVRLVQVRFPSLMENLLRLDSPMEVAARMAKMRAFEQTGIPMDEIGAFFISPCAAKVTSVKAPFGKEKSDVDAVFAMKDIHLPLLDQMKKMNGEHEVKRTMAGPAGVLWACTGGESSRLEKGRHIAVHGIASIIAILEEAVEGRLEDVSFIEALSCMEGCLGGPLTVENPFVSKTNLHAVIEAAEEADFDKACLASDPNELEWALEMPYVPILKLDDDLVRALEKLQRIDAIEADLPGLDCGACGAPSCRALAEDIVREMAKETDCIFKLREEYLDLVRRIGET